uniref:TATA-box-binding protein n=1 Tax=Globisporangium ultimum (strain ATCC 200006 / CBS 805.95 / DAOM BR144) TaxID=431595 RepID=K3WYW4_GLOUD
MSSAMSSSSFGGALSGPTDPAAFSAADAPADRKASELQIKNFVCSANLGMRFDLSNLFTKSHKKAELVSKKNCIVMKLGAPRATAMLFANGKLVCTGAETEDAIKAAARKFTQIIQKMDYPGVNLIDFKIQNVVGTCELGFRVLVEELSFAHHDCCTYEPELYPALIYRLEKPKVKILVFVSGKVVFTGSKDPRELYAAFDAILPILHEFKDTKRVDVADPSALDGAGLTDAADSAMAKQKEAGGHGGNDDDDDDQSMEDDSHLDN